MQPELERLARESGFRIFDGRAVAADGGISGEATASLERFAMLVEQRAMERCAVAFEATHPHDWGLFAAAIRSSAPRANGGEG